MISGLSNNSSSTAGERKAAWRSSANEMRAPGSFPYRTRFTLDRETGGDGHADERGVFCWALEEGRVIGEGVRVAEEEIGGLEERVVEDVGGDVGDKCGCRWDS